MQALEVQHRGDTGMNDDKKMPVYTSGTGSDGRPYVHGPGHGMGYDSGTLWPELRLSNMADAGVAAALCCTAYKQGYAQAQRDIRAALGVV